MSLGLGVILGERRILEIVSSSADADGPTQKFAQLWCGLVTTIDGILDIAQDMGEIMSHGVV